MKHALEQANLLSGVRNDIEYAHAFHFLSNGPKVDFLIFSAYKSSAADSLLAERGRIDSSHRMTDDILEYMLHFRVLCSLTDCLIDKPMRLAQSLADNERH